MISDACGIRSRDPTSAQIHSQADIHGTAPARSGTMIAKFGKVRYRDGDDADVLGAYAPVTVIAELMTNPMMSGYDDMPIALASFVPESCHSAKH